MKSVLISGATSGIGLACARHLHMLGWQVFAGVYPSEDTDALTTGISERLHVIPLDITEQDMIRAAKQQIEQHTPTLDGLVNNAGIGITGPMEFLPMDDVRRQMEVNYFGHVAMTQTFIPMLRGARGRIVNITSILGRITLPFSGPYCASKFALEAFTDVIRMELQPWGIHVSAIEPTIVQTAIWKKQEVWQAMVREELPPQAKELYLDKLERMAESMVEQQGLGISPQIVAETIADALTSVRPKTRYVVGRDGGVLDMLWRIVPDRWRDQILMRRLKVW